MMLLRRCHSMELPFPTIHPRFLGGRRLTLGLSFSRYSSPHTTVPVFPFSSGNLIASDDGELAEEFPSKQLIYHKFNESQREQVVLRRLLGGEIVALKSAAGMPGISDPGMELVKLSVDKEPSSLFGQYRHCVIAREITKWHEEVRSDSQLQFLRELIFQEHSLSMAVELVAPGTSMKRKGNIFSSTGEIR